MRFTIFLSLHFSMVKIDNPSVTLEDEARTGVKEDVRSGFLDWLSSFVVKGDDGETYVCAGSILSLAIEKIDIVSIVLSKGFGKAQQIPSSVYKICRYPGSIFDQMIKQPKGTLKIEKEKDKVIVTCGKQFKVECNANHTWHLFIELPENKYKAEFWHRPQGFPLWYGRDKPSYLTQHSITYGYNWSGQVDGWFELEGKHVNVNGFGIRERYVAVDSSAAELGGWEDWGFVAFNEIHSSFYDMRLGMKDLSIYDIENKKHYPEGKMTIEHSDWAFLRELDGFIPTIYTIRIEVEDGVYEVHAHVGNATTWGVTFKVPDNPVATLVFDKVEGTFSTKDGKIRTLTGGTGSLSIRQWHAYPNILPRELYCDDVRTGENFETLLSL